MKSILENLFSGFLESKKVSNDSADIDSKKNILSSDSDNFSADLNMFLVGEKKDLEKSIKQVDGELKNENPNKVINTSKNEIEKNKLVMDLKSTNLEEKQLHESKQSINKIMELTHRNEGNRKETNKFINNDKVSAASFLKKKHTTSTIINNNQVDFRTTINGSKKEKKIKTFFTNYLNFNSTKKNFNKNKKFLKFISSNNLISDFSSNSKLSKKNNFILKNSFKEQININTIEKNAISLSNKGIELNINLDGSENQKNNNLNSVNSNMLKNILDLKSGDINQRMAEIFERNLKLGNNKFEIEIKPENLGKIEISMEINGDKVDISMKVDNNSVANLVTESNATLQKSLSSQGLNLNNLNLSFNNQNKFGDENLKKEKRNNTKNKVEEEESLDLQIEKHHKSNNLVYIKA